MSLPQFNAEASLGPAIGRYAANAVFGESGVGEVSPNQNAAASFVGEIWRGMRCCGYSMLTHRIECTGQWVTAFDWCECIRTRTGPTIICFPPENL